LEEEERVRKERIEWQKEQRRLQEERQSKARIQEERNKINIAPIDSSANVNSSVEWRNVVEAEQRNCLNCQSNLTWANRDGWANCGGYISLGLPQQRIDPEYAKQCPRFRLKKQ
jgi:hypothetical protein